MSNLKKVAAVVLALGSSAVFAGTMGPSCAPGPVLVPCAWEGWDFGVQALYLQTVYGGEWGYNTVTTTDTATGTNTVYGNDGHENWGWGFKLEGSYHFNTGNDVNINWYHKSKTHNFVGGENFISSEISPFTSISFKPRWDAVNGEFGQQILAGEFKRLRFHGGVQYTRISHTFDGWINSTNVFNAKSTFNGFGPRTGLDMSYNVGNGFGIYGNGAVAILAGNSKFSAGILNNEFTLSGSKRSLVPELEAKLGVTYGYAMAQGNLTLDAGWMMVNYFNVQNFGPTSDTNVGFQGPFVGLKYVGVV